MDRFSGLYLLGIFIIVFGSLKPQQFLTLSTLHSVASQQVVTALMALAVLVPLACGVYDLSVGAIVNFSTVTICTLITVDHWNMWLAIAAGIACSMGFGIVNGFIVVKLRVNSFIATLGTATVITAIQQIVNGQNTPLPPTSSAWQRLTLQQVFGFQIVVVYLVIIALVAWRLMDHTPPGRYIYAVGGNEEAARLAGVRTGQWKWLSLVWSATICGIAGVIYASLIGPSVNFGNSLLLPAFAAVFLGATQLKPGRFNVWGTVLAVYVLATGVEGMQFVTSVQWLDDMFNGVALIAAVAFAGWRQRQVKRPSVTVDESPTDAPQLETVGKT